MSETTHGGWTPEEEPEPTVFQQITDIVDEALQAQAGGDEGVLTPASERIRELLEGVDYSTLRQVIVVGAGASMAAKLGADPSSIDARAIITANGIMQEYLRDVYPEQMAAGSELHKLITEATLAQAELHNNAIFNPDDSQQL